MASVANIVNDMDAVPLPAPQSVSNFTPLQWRDQLLQNAKAVSAAVAKLGSITSASTAQINMANLNNVAKDVATAVEGLVTVARSATASEGDTLDGEQPMMDGSRAVAENIARVMKATKELAANPNDPKAKENLKKAQELLNASINFLNGAASGDLADVPTARLIAESAK